MDRTVIELFAGVGGFRVGLNDIREIVEPPYELPCPRCGHEMRCDRTALWD